MFGNGWSGLGKRSECEQAEPEGFGGTDALSDGLQEKRFIENVQSALKLHGRVGPVSPRFVEKLSASRNSSERFLMKNKSSSLRLAMEPLNQILALGDRNTPAVFLSGTVGIVDSELFGWVSQQTEPVRFV